MRDLRHIKRDPKTRNWVYVRRVPRDVQASFGKKVFERSLGSADKRRIEDAWSKVNSEFLNRVEDIRRANQGLKEPYWHPMMPGPPGNRNLQIPLLLQAVKEWKDRVLFDYAAELINSPLTAAESTNLEIMLVLQGKEKPRDTCALGGYQEDEYFAHDPDPFQHDMLDGILCRKAWELLEDMGLQLEQFPDNLAVITQLIRSAWLDAMYQCEKWRDGDWSIMPPQERPPVRRLVAPPVSQQPLRQPLATPTKSKRGAMRISELAEAYLADVKPKADTVRNVRMVVRRFNEFMEGRDMVAAEITRQDVIRFRMEAARFPASLTDAMQAKSFRELVAMDHKATLTPKTVAKWLAMLKPVLSWGVDNGVLTQSVAAGLRTRDKQQGSMPRRAFTPSEIETIFSAPIYAEHRGLTPAMYWLPLLGAFTGARIGELCQLTRRDVQVEGGVWFLNITTEKDEEDEGERTLKTESSHRFVPVHETLLGLGILELVQSVNSGRLLNIQKGYASRLFGKTLSSLEIKKDRSISFHSFRHSFKTNCRGVIDEEIHDALTGHAPVSVARRYGHVRLDTLAEAMGRYVLRGFPEGRVRPWKA